jgi:hypothetical protein
LKKRIRVGKARRSRHRQRGDAAVERSPLSLGEKRDGNRDGGFSGDEGSFGVLRNLTTSLQFDYLTSHGNGIFA